MGMKQDFTDIYTKSSVYYLRLQYLVICYLIVLAAAFFILPLPRAFGVDGVARLMIGGLLYIAFAVLMIYAPKLFYPQIGKTLSPYKDAKEVEEKFNRLSDKEKQEVEKAVEAEYGVSFKKNGVLVLTMNKMQKIATNMFFQCLLLELFCLVVLLNNDHNHSLLISNPVTQEIAEVLQNYTDSTPPKYNNAFFSISSDLITDGKELASSMPFSEFAYMAEALFFIYIVSMVSLTVRTVAMFVISRPMLVAENVFTIVKNAKTIKKFIWALFATFIVLLVSIAIVYGILGELGFYILEMNDLGYWVKFSGLWFLVATLWVPITWRFMEDWYKLIFRKF